MREFSAGDAADGSLGARGSLGLNAAAPNAELTATLKHFRIAARDETVVTASGDVAISGAIAAPKVTAHLTAEAGDITLPDRLPPSVARLKVVEINRSNPNGPAPPSQKAEPPAVPAALDIELECPAGLRAPAASTASGAPVKVGTTHAPDRRSTSRHLRRVGKADRPRRITFDGAQT